MTIEINKGAHNYYWQFECQKFSPKAQNNGLLKLHWGKKKPTKLQTQKKKNYIGRVETHAQWTLTEKSGARGGGRVVRG